MLDAAAKQVKPKAAANWILSDISKYLNDKAVSLKDTKMTADKLVALVKLIEAGTISGNAGKKVLPSMFETDETVEAIVERMGLKQVSDEGAILAIVQDVLAKNEKAVADFKAGKNVTGFLVGQCMKASKDQGNPQIINKLIAAELALSPARRAAVRGHPGTAVNAAGGRGAGRRGPGGAGARASGPRIRRSDSLLRP